MLNGLPKFDHPEALVNIMESYGYRRLRGDKPAQHILGNSGLLKPFHDNAFGTKLKLRNNFYQSFKDQDVLLGYDPKLKTAWFIAESRNRVTFTNYFRDAVTLGLKSAGLVLVGATVKLTPAGWQNLHDLLSDDFLEKNPEMKRVEVMSLVDGVRWRRPTLGVGVMFLNFRDQVRIGRAAQAAIRGETGEDIQN